MNEENKEECNCNCNTTKTKCNAAGGCIYGLGVIGAAVYYISAATTFWTGVIGFLKALVWPAFLVYQALALFGK